jgi:hypothetical protein
MIHVDTRKLLEICWSNGAIRLHFEVEDHIQLASIKPYCIQDLFGVFNAWHLSNRESVVFFQDLADSKKVLVKPWTTSKVFVARLIFLIGSSDWGIWETGYFADEIDHIHSITISDKS